MIMDYERIYFEESGCGLFKVTVPAFALGD
jgi:hypothetical protein